MKIEIDLLNQAAFEIKRLRKENELMSARLDMFDKCIMMIHTQPHYSGRLMSPDLVCEIEKHVDIMVHKERGDL